MKKIFLFSLFFCLAFSLNAGISFVSMSDEESYDSVNDFTNTYEINLNKHQTKDIVKCQAVRLARNWFVTAAHCVKNACEEGDCSFQARLVVGPNYEADFTTTQAKKLSRKIFTFSKTKLDAKELLYDIALIYFDPKETKTIFKDPSTMRSLTENQFLNRVPNRAVYVRAINGTNLPKILVINNKKSFILERDLSIISIWSGKKTLLKSSKQPVFYSPKVSNFVTRNFGVIKGISGSGVMTNTGELLGIVSAKGDLVRQTPVDSTAMPLLYIAPFDEEVLAFISAHLPNISYIVADESFYRDLTETEKQKLKIIENVKLNLK